MIGGYDNWEDSLESQHLLQDIRKTGHEGKKGDGIYEPLDLQGWCVDYYY